MTERRATAFVPFCAFKSDLAISNLAISNLAMSNLAISKLAISNSSLKLPGTNFPFCSLFQPTILEGRLCYKLQLKMKSGEGKSNELMLLIDHNQDLSLYNDDHADNIKEEIVFNSTKLNLKTFGSHRGSQVKVQINTISPKIGFGRGSYRLTAVKRMTATSSFLEMSFKERNCNVEEYDDCRTRRLLQACDCLPWEVSGFQVSFITLPFSW